jgi:hypothetical protein
MLIDPPPGERFHQAGDQTREADQEADISLSATQMGNVERQGRKEEEEARKVTKRDQTQEDEIAGEKKRFGIIHRWNFRKLYPTSTSGSTKSD